MQSHFYGAFCLKALIDAGVLDLITKVSTAVPRAAPFRLFLAHSLAHPARVPGHRGPQSPSAEGSAQCKQAAADKKAEEVGKAADRIEACSRSASCSANAVCGALRSCVRSQYGNIVRPVGAGRACARIGHAWQLEMGPARANLPRRGRVSGSGLWCWLRSGSANCNLFTDCWAVAACHAVGPSMGLWCACEG
jgi:hypothetical protein